MGRSSRIVFLTITAILAIFVFVAMWVVKPSGNSNVLTAARERQNTPLVSVEKPLETDIKTLSQEEEFEQKVRKLLAEDPDFLEKLTQSIKASLLADSSFTQELESQVDSVVASRVDERVDYYVSIYEPQIEEMLSSYKDEVYKNVNSKLESALEIQGLVDRLITPVTEAVYEDFVAKEGFDIETVTQLVLNSIASDREALKQEVINIAYEETTAALDEVDEIVKELKADVMNTISQQEKPIDEVAIREIVDQIYKENQDKMIVDTVNKVLSQIDSIINNKVQSYVDNITPPEAPRFINQIVVAPSLDNMAVPEAEYLDTRNSAREEAIKKVLDSLKWLIEQVVIGLLFLHNLYLEDYKKEGLEEALIAPQFPFFLPWLYSVQNK